MTTDGHADAIEAAMATSKYKVIRAYDGHNSIVSRTEDEWIEAMVHASVPHIEAGLRRRIAEELWNRYPDFDPMNARHRAFRAAARMVAPEPTDDEMRTALSGLLGAMPRGTQTTDDQKGQTA